MNQPQPQSIQFSTLISDIEGGRIKIPQFQRDFVWTKDKSAKLLDSILKGFPIGTFILWKTKEQLRTVRNIGNAVLPETPAGDFVQHVLDGQQRLTSLYASVKGLTVERDGIAQNFSGIYIDLEAPDDGDLVLTEVEARPAQSYIPFVELLNADFTFLAAFPQKFHEKLKSYQKRLQSYSFSAILVNDAPIDIATEIFTRINVSGKPLSLFEIMVAKTFDKARGFDLAEKYKSLIERLSEIEYGTVPSVVVLQAVAAILTKEIRKKEILALERTKVIDAWPSAVSAIEAAAEYFRNCYRIPVSNLLPYPALLIPFTYYFYNHPDKPTNQQKEYLQDLFWRVALTARYSGPTETNISQDIRRIDKILADEIPNYDFGVDTSPEFISKNGNFNAGRSFIKAILCLYAYKEPKSFLDDSVVRISNDWLKRANSRNYHHFYPRAFFKRSETPEWLVNHIANITIVDDFLNKRQIGSKPPSLYMREFEKKNPTLANTMLTHLIRLDQPGTLDDDYMTFHATRCQSIATELQKRIIPCASDKAGQATVSEPTEGEDES